MAQTRRPRELDVAAWHADLGCSTREAALRDLLLTRVAVAVASHPELRDELLLRGGLALHRLVLPSPLRACVGLEYTRRSTSGIGAVLDVLREAAGRGGARGTHRGPAPASRLPHADLAGSAWSPAPPGGSRDPGDPAERRPRFAGDSRRVATPMARRCSPTTRWSSSGSCCASCTVDRGAAICSISGSGSIGARSTTPPCSRRSITPAGSRVSGGSHGARSSRGCTAISR